MNTEKMQEHIIGLLESMGINLEDPNFKETPKRMVRMYEEILGGLKIDQKEEVKKILDKNFPTTYKGMVVQTGLKVNSMCPHHFAVVRYSIDFGIIYNQNCIGLSKIFRAIDILSKAPVLQEEFTENIINSFYECLNPKGVIVIVKGYHGCMEFRGIKQAGLPTITSSMKGIFEDDLGARDEFLQMIK